VPTRTPLIRLVTALLVVCFVPVPSRAENPLPPHLPRYEVALSLDTATHRGELRERVTWTNNTSRATDELVFNFYPHYCVPQGDYLLLAKTLEMLRLQPSLGIDRQGRFGRVKEARLIGFGDTPLADSPPLEYRYECENMTALRFRLPRPVKPGETVTVELDCCYTFPNKQGRLGYWNGVTFLTNSLPLVAFYDECGWRPMPFVPWHQPWCNEAGVFTANIKLPEAEMLACPAVIRSEASSGKGWKTVTTEPFVGRDFAILASPRYHEFKSHTQLPDGRRIELRCLAFPEHEFYANEILKIVGEAIPVYSQWFGPFPYPSFTLAESYFGWNGNECAGLVMIDERVFAMPHLARGYVEYLVSHETCHQWWYNHVGTNGYAEPFMDEGAATYFTHRLLDLKNGKNNAFLDWPAGLKWLPNINRDNYRNSGTYLAIRNGEMHPAAQDLPQYGHLFGLFTGAYDRGSKAFGMIEAQLGEAAFLDFIRGVVAKYGWRVLQAAYFQKELEAYTGRSWAAFFERWIYGKGLTDWSVENVSVADGEPPQARRGSGRMPAAEKRYSLVLRQWREYPEATTLGIRPAGQTGFPIRIPVVPAAGLVRDTMPGGEVEYEVEPIGEKMIRVSFTTPAEVEQIAVDPDNVLLDADPGNNVWKSSPGFRATPLYTLLDETDLTTNYDRWNFTAGPWAWGASYSDPWYTRSTMAGVRVGAYRTQQWKAGAYAAYRSDFRDLIAGVDAVHYGPKQETGFNWEVRVGGPWGSVDGAASPHRASAYHRWVIKQTSSLYLPPMIYHETFATYQDNFLPIARTTAAGAERWDRSMMWGWHFRANLYTPYWNPECGFWVDLTAGVGAVDMPLWRETGQVRAELAAVKKLPDWTGPMRNARVAGRVMAVGALPDQGQFFSLGGGTVFRGYDMAERQGSMMWVANAELRVPLVEDVEWDCLDHTLGTRGLWLAGFYDVGDVYANGHSVGGRVAHAAGVGVRMDIAVFSFIERATLRFDVAKTINDNTPFQFWFGIQHPF
jgi:hypothetical protein